MNQQGLTLQGITGLHALHILNALFMVATGIYLTTHYYDTLYPTSLGAASTLCDVSAFWNCDVATHSKIAAVAGVPIAFLGLLNGLFLLGASIFPSESYERTASAITKYNAVGTIALMLFSLVALKGLCPVCTIYYVLSWIAAALFWKKGLNSWKPELKIAGIWLAVLLVSGSAIAMYTNKRAEKQNNLSAQVVQQYQKLADYGDPDTPSPFVLHASTPNFADAPIRISVFSDFQCPFCKMVAEQMAPLARRYNGKINIQYFFYPLDSACNSNVKHAMHPFACQAAMLSACDPAKFGVVHDEIFAQQEGLDADKLKGIAQKHGLAECLDKQSSRDAVLASLNGATKFNLRSTPTIIINGKKIEGSIPNPHYEAIFNSILQK